MINLLFLLILKEQSILMYIEK